MKILAIPATNSPNGVNRRLLGHAADLLTETQVDAEVEILDLNDYEMPIYSQAREQNDGIPELARRFFDKIGQADAVIVSFAEYNGSYTSAWKNVYDWASRIDAGVYQGKKVAMFAATPGPRGGAGVLGNATLTAPFFGADLVGSLGIGSFGDNFDSEAGRLTNPELSEQFEKVLAALAD
jgi:NAD(P)H-dependent FMN reductase